MALALEVLSEVRAHQVVLCSIICATRFKTLVGGQLLGTECRKCRTQDGFEHLLQGAELEIPAERMEEPEPTVEFLVLLARRAHEINPGLPIPRYGPVEIMLGPEQPTTPQQTEEGAPRIEEGEISLAELSSDQWPGRERVSQ